jgi:phosphatidylglycerophosphate synthase
VTAVSESGTPPLRQFLNLRFAARSPLWSQLVFERIGGLLAYVFARARIRPNTVTLAGGVCGVSGAVLLGLAGGTAEIVAAGILLGTAYSLDCADGQLARATGRSTPAGAWLDVTVDAVVTSFVAVAVSAALLSNGQGPLVSLLTAGAFGASRTAVLFTATRVRSDHGGLRLTGLWAVLRTAFLAVIDTPFIYVLLCVFRFRPAVFLGVVVSVTVLSAVQAIVSAGAHFGSAPRPVAESNP